MHKIVHGAVALGALVLAASAAVALAAEPMTKDDSGMMGETGSMDAMTPKSGTGDAMMSGDKMGAGMQADDDMMKDDAMKKDEPGK